jgi:hypothetical protein
MIKGFEEMASSFNETLLGNAVNAFLLVKKLCQNLTWLLNDLEQRNKNYYIAMLWMNEALELIGEQTNYRNEQVYLLNSISHIYIEVGNKNSKKNILYFVTFLIITKKIIGDN